MQKVKVGDFVVIKLGNDAMKLEKIQLESQLNMGRFGKIRWTAEILAQIRYACTYEVLQNFQLREMNSDELNWEHLMGTSSAVDQTDSVGESLSTENNNNNQTIVDSGSVQTITPEDIASMVRNQDDCQTMIKALTDNHSQFHLKTAYSKAKYIKRKKEKFMRKVTFLRPTAQVLSLFYQQKYHEKVRQLRVDMLSMITTAMNISAGGRYLVVDDTAGLATLAILERMHGSGSTLLSLNSMQFVSEQQDCLRFSQHSNENSEVTLRCLPACLIKAKVESDKAVLKYGQKKDYIIERNRIQVEAQNCYENGDFDGVLIASKYDSLSVLHQILPKLALCAPILIYQPHQEMLYGTYLHMMASSEFVNVSLRQFRTREYQVFSNRVHPMNNTDASSGFLLSALRVDPAQDQMADVVIEDANQVGSSADLQQESSFTDYSSAERNDCQEPESKKIKL